MMQAGIDLVISYTGLKNQIICNRTGIDKHASNLHYIVCSYIHLFALKTYGTVLTK